MEKFTHRKCGSEDKRERIKDRSRATKGRQQGSSEKECYSKPGKLEEHQSELVLRTNHNNNVHSKVKNFIK